jgi:CheY-like chemotaxis protein
MNSAAYAGDLQAQTCSKDIAQCSGKGMRTVIGGSSDSRPRKPANALPQDQTRSQNRNSTPRPAMPKTILLVSRDPKLQAARALILERAGYRTMRTNNLTSAVQLAAHCQMSIIGHTFNLTEQDSFIDRVHEANPSVFILCLRFGLEDSHALLKAVANCFTTQPGGSRICVLEPSNVIAWPQKAS